MTDRAGSTTEGEAFDQGRRLAAFAAIYLFWGGTFLALRYAVAEVPPLLTIAIRCAGGAALLSLWCAVRGRLERTTWAEWRVAAVAGALLFVGSHGILAWAEQNVPSGQAALLMTSIPLWLVVLDSSIHRRWPHGRIVIGLALGVLGIYILTRGGGSWAGTTVERVALVFSGLCWAGGSLVARHGPRPTSAIQATAMQLATGAVWVGLGSAALGELAGWSPSGISSRALVALAFLVICGTTLAFAAFTWLMRVASAAAVGTYAFVNPLIAVALAWAVGDEAPRAATAVAAALVIGAVILAREPSRRRMRGRDAEAVAGR